MASEDENSRDGGEQRIEAILRIAESLAADDVHDGYIRIGSATSGAFRFKWTVRQQHDGRFIVDETVGSGSVAVSSRPLLKADVLAYIDERQRRVQAKVGEVKRELAGVQGITGEAEQGGDGQRDPLQMYDEIRRLLKESNK